MADRRTPHALATVAITGALLVLLPGTALAHASFDVRQVPAGSSQQLVLRVPLERDATNELVEVLVPGAFSVDSCDAAEGWTCRQDATADGNVVLRFERAPDGPGDTERFAVAVTAPQAEGVYAFPTIQTYDDGEEEAWIGEPGSDRPAPRIQVGDETAPVESTADATPHGELAGEPDATATPDTGSAATPSADVTDAASAAPTDATAPASPTATPDEDGADGGGEAAVEGAVLAIIAAVAVVIAGVGVLWRRRRR